MNQRSPLRNLSKGSDKNNPRNKGFDGFLKTNKQTNKKHFKDNRGNRLQSCCYRYYIICFLKKLFSGFQFY